MKARGLGRIYRRHLTKHWWIQYNHNGKVYRESSGSAVRADAARLLRKRLAELTTGHHPARAGERLTFADMARMLTDELAIKAKSHTRERAAAALKHLEAAFGSIRPTDITKDLLTGYVKGRFDEEAARATVQVELKFLSWMFTIAVDAGRLDRKPAFPSIRVENARQGFYERPDFEKMVSYFSEDLRPVAWFLYLTGWRVNSEVLCLRWTQVDFQAGAVRLEVNSTKNDQGRIFPFSLLPELRDLLLRQWEKTQAVQRRTGKIVPWVFHRFGGQPIKNIRQAWATACRKAGMPGRLPHDCRRTAVRNLVRAGVPETIAMRLTGHKTRAVFDRYNITSDRDLQEAVQRLAAFHRAPPSAPAESTGELPPRTSTVVAQFGA